MSMSHVSRERSVRSALRLFHVARACTGKLLAAVQPRLCCHSAPLQVQHHNLHSIKRSCFSQENTHAGKRRTRYLELVHTKVSYQATTIALQLRWRMEIPATQNSSHQRPPPTCQLHLRNNNNKLQSIYDKPCNLQLQWSAGSLILTRLHVT
jgi:hypothetical protein